MVNRLMQSRVSFLISGDLLKLCVPPHVSDADAIAWLRNVAEYWPSRLSIYNSTTMYLEIELGSEDADRQTVLSTAEQLLLDITRTDQIKALSPFELENLVSAVIDRSLGKK